MSIKVFQLFKPESNNITEIQDRFCVSQNQKVIAFADGTTQSYKSEEWAQFLVDEFVKNPVFNKKGFDEFIKKSSDNFKNKIQLSNHNKSQAFLIKKKIEKGCDAAFIAITIDVKKNTIQAIAYGDSKLHLIDNHKLLNSFPNTNDSNFINSKLIDYDSNHIKILNQKVDKSIFND